MGSSPTWASSLSLALGLVCLVAFVVWVFIFLIVMGVTTQDTSAKRIPRVSGWEGDTVVYGIWGVCIPGPSWKVSPKTTYVLLYILQCSVLFWSVHVQLVQHAHCTLTGTCTVTQRDKVTNTHLTTPHYKSRRVFWVHYILYHWATEKSPWTIIMAQQKSWWIGECNDGATFLCLNTCMCFTYRLEAELHVVSLSWQRFKSPTHIKARISTGEFKPCTYNTCNHIPREQWSELWVRPTSTGNQWSHQCELRYRNQRV